MAISEERREGGEANVRRDVRHAAWTYVRRGWRVVELRPRDKAPAHSGWQEARIDQANIDATFLPGSNIGLLTGKASGGLVDVDCYTLEAQVAATTLMPLTPMMHGRASGGGVRSQSQWADELLDLKVVSRWTERRRPGL